MRVFAATKNAGKLRELQAILAVLGWSVEACDAYLDPPEPETTYAGNAALKARALRATLHARGERAAVLADDSGLEVTALEGRPGVRSARYGPPGATWPQRRRMLLGEVDAAAAGRSARFVCALHFIDEDGCETAVEGAIEGEIAAHERGAEGFSYDAIFYYQPLRRTFGELSAAEKNGISHRTRAAAALVRAVERRATSDRP